MSERDHAKTLDNKIREISRALNTAFNSLDALLKYKEKYEEKMRQSRMPAIQLKSVTQDVLRTYFLKLHGPKKTIEIVNDFFPAASKSERTKLIKTVSVILNVLEKNGEIRKEKKKGVKGNYYYSKK